MEDILHNLECILHSYQQYDLILEASILGLLLFECRSTNLLVLFRWHQQMMFQETTYFVYNLAHLGFQREAAKICKETSNNACLVGFQFTTVLFLKEWEALGPRIPGDLGFVFIFSSESGRRIKVHMFECIGVPPDHYHTFLHIHLIQFVISTWICVYNLYVSVYLMVSVYYGLCTPLKINMEQWNPTIGGL